MDLHIEGRYFFLDNGARVYRAPNNEVRKVHREFAFETFEAGDQRIYQGADIRRLTNAAYVYAKGRRIPWKFSVWKEGDGVIVRRVK